MSEFHRTSAWVKLRTRLVAEARRINQPCQICGHPIDYTASGRTPWGPSLDHIVPVSVQPELGLNPTNLRMVHAHCNRAPKLAAVVAQDRARRGHSPSHSRDDSHTAPPPPNPIVDTPEPWQRAYAACMAAATGAPVSHWLDLNSSRPWSAPWSVADYEAGRVDEDGRLRA